MIAAVLGLSAELRRVRVPVTTGEIETAIAALEHVDLADRGVLREALGACLVKSPDERRILDVLFEVYFGNSGGDPERWMTDLRDDELRELVLEALATRNRRLLAALATEAVDRHARLDPEMAVAGTLYVSRTSRALGGDDLADDDAAVLTAVLEEQVRRRLVEARGADAVAAGLRRPLPTDVDFLTASTARIQEMRAQLAPLGRRLARQLAHRGRSRRGRLHAPRTARAAAGSGGVPVVLHHRPPRPPKPRLVVLADISGSVASFAGFALQLAYALRGQFATVRTFVFVDGLDEVTDILTASRTIADSTARINAERRGVGFDAHSDYGRAFSLFVDRHLSSVDQRTTVLVLGDGRTNYRDPRVDSLTAIGSRAGHLYWLNPEREQLWQEGDSAMHRYVPACDRAVECRTVRQLGDFVAALA